MVEDLPRSGYALKVLHFGWNLVERWMAIDFVLGRIKERIFINRIAGIEVCGSHGPDADPFVATGINVAGIFDSHLGVCRMQAADVFMGESILTSNENFPQRPFIHK